MLSVLTRLFFLSLVDVDVKIIIFFDVIVQSLFLILTRCVFGERNFEINHQSPVLTSRAMDVKRNQTS
jgi:hypothetical protein